AVDRKKPIPHANAGASGGSAGRHFANLEPGILAAGARATPLPRLGFEHETEISGTERVRDLERLESDVGSVELARHSQNQRLELFAGVHARQSLAVALQHRVPAGQVHVLAVETVAQLPPDLAQLLFVELPEAPSLLGPESPRYERRSIRRESQ